MTSLTPPTRPPAKRDALRVAARQLRFQSVIAPRPVFLLAILALFLASVSVAHAQTTTPTVSTVAVTSNPGTDDTYALGDTIEVALTFSEAVTVTGAPYLLIDVGGTNRRASYHSGTGATQLLFRYTVRAGDDDDDGIAVVENSLTLNGGTIVATDDSTTATLDHAALTTTAHKVDIVVTLLSNFGQTESTNFRVSATNDEVLEFTTGGNSGGYQLDSVVLDVKSPSDTLQVEVRLHEVGDPDLFDNPKDHEPKATLTGSVTTAGRQTFTMDPGPGGNLAPSRHFILAIVGSGTGTVELGTVAGDGEDSGGADGWAIQIAQGIIPGVDDPLDYYYLKVDVTGHPGAIPYLLAASITNVPLNGHTHHAGEHIEITLQTSMPVAANDGVGRVPLWLGDGEENYRGARPVGGDFRFNDNWSGLAVYKIQQDDEDSDGVILGEDVVWDDGIPLWKNALDTTVPISPSLEFATVDTDPGYPVDGSRAWDCEQVLCAYSEFERDIRGFGLFANAGSLTNRYFRYADEEYIIAALIHFPGGRLTSMFLAGALAGSDRAIDNLAVVFSGTVFPLREAAFEVDSQNYGLKISLTEFDWVGPAVEWMEGERPLFQLVENVDVSFASETYEVDEDGTVEVELTLSTDLGRDVTVPITVVNQDGATDDDYSAPESISIEAGETSKKFVVTPEDDDVDDDGESLQIVFGDLPDNLSPGETTETVVTIVDNDDPEVEVSFDQSAYDVAEGGNVTITVNLSADPERTVAVPLTATRQDGASGADYSVPASVTFDTGETTKTITFTATQDDIDDDGEKVLLGFGASLPDRVSASTTTPSATVTILDDDARGVTVSPTSLPVDEGMTAEYTVVLKSEPTGNVTVRVNDPTDNTDVTANPASLTFDENDWDTPKTVTVSAVQDADGVNDTATVTHTVGGADYASETASDVSVAVVDDETPDVTIAPTGITVLPGGSNEYTVVLDTEPTVQVTVTVTEHADTVLSVSPEQLTFDANDWDTPKTVEVSADDSVTTTETITLAHGLAGGEYRSVTADDVAVTVVKASGTLDFQIGITASPQALTVPEDKSRSYSAFLSAVPTGDVTVTINLPTGNDLSIDKSSLTFTTDNWNVPQAVRVSAADDDDGIQDAPVTIGHTVSGGGYGSGDNFGITVTIEENDTPAVTLSTVSLVIAEGEEATYTVALDTQPSDDVTVVINDPTDNTDVTAAPASLTFTRSNWSAPQTVTVTTIVDHDTDTDTATVTHTVSGGDYAAVTAKDVDVTVTDGCIVIWCGVLIMEKDPRFTRELRTVSLEDDDFEYKGTDYRIDRPKLYGGGPDPQEDYPLTVRIPERAWFKLDVPGPLHETEHYLDWTLYVNGVELPFSQAKRVRDDIPGNWGILFKWYGREFHELFPPGDLGTGATLYLSIKETPRDTQTPKAPGPPLHLTVETQNRDELWATWTRPQRRDDDDRNLYVDSYRVQWKEGSGDWETPADVTEATLTPMSARFFYTHVIEGLPPGVEYEVRVIATNAVGDSEPSNVAAGMIEPDSSSQQSTELRSNSPATGGPGISGTPLVGETLTATTSGIQDEDGLTDADFAYQWLRSELGSNSETDIAGATGSSYAVTSDDAGKAIKVRVTFTDDAGNEESLTSFGVIAAPALPEAQVPDAPGRPDVSPQVSGSLAVSWTGPASDGGSAVTGYKVQWKEAADSWDAAADVSEATATETSHTITGLTDGTEYSVRVLAINDVGESPPSEDGNGTPRETVPPDLSEASVDGAALTLIFNEALDGNSAPPTTAFTVTVNGNERGVDSVDVTGGAVTLTLASAAISEDTVTVSYAVPARESADRLRDSAGNAAASFTGRSVTNDTSPTHAFTASVHDAPESHDGQNAFTFELRLSEAPKQGFSYKTLRDHAFTVTGGEVLKARRLEKGKNVRWEIHVRPDSSGNVTIVLPITEDCDAQGAICTGDGRPLSNRLELTVSGPGG